MSQRHENIACTACGCVCDDLVLTTADGKITAAEGACHLATPWFAQQESKSPPPAMCQGVAVDPEIAYEKAAACLRSARSPLIFGLSHSSTEGQRAAVRLADRIGATIDTTASYCHAPSIVGFQEVGESTCSLGETKNRADLVIYWGSNPVLSHPRHMERYSLEPKGTFVPQGRADRRLVVLDVKRTETAELADFFVPIEAGRDFDVLWTLRGLLQGIAPADPADCGAGIEELSTLSEWMKDCRSGVVFFGYGLARTGLGHRNVEALLRLVTDLNLHTCFYARRMRVPGDVTGADSVLCWQTGYPFSVHLGRGFPRYNPGEFSGPDMLEREEVDACLFIGGEGMHYFSPAALKHLQTIPTILLDGPHAEPTCKPTVHLTTAVHGIHLPGTAYRMDEVPIRLRAVLPARYPSDAETLAAIEARL